jgi:hypothetical protein
MTDLIDTLIEKLKDWKENNYDSPLVTNNFDLNDDDCIVYNEPKLDETETLIYELLQKFIPIKYDYATLHKLNEMIQIEKQNQGSVSDCSVEVEDHHDDFVRVKIIYGWWYWCISRYNYYPNVDKFAPVSFSQSSYNGRNGGVHNEFDSTKISLTIDDVFNEVIDRFE